MRLAAVASAVSRPFAPPRQPRPYLLSQRFQRAALCNRGTNTRFVGGLLAGIRLSTRQPTNKNAHEQHEDVKPTPEAAANETQHGIISALIPMQVRDAETSELLVVPVHVGSAVLSPSPSKRAKPSNACSLPPLRSPSAVSLREEGQAQEERQRSPNHQDQEKAAVIFPETQSTRPMGAGVDWQSGQQARVERAELRFRVSLQGLRAELQRKDLDRATREAIEIQILEKMKTQYAEQIRLMVVEEMQREMEREVEMRLELSVLGKERLRKKHDRDRGFYKAQIERVRAECELSLVASMAQYNLLR